MDTTITRHGSIQSIGVFGNFSVAGIKYATVEREWLDNKKFVSCIPAGEYRLTPHRSTRKNQKVDGLCYAIVNERLGVYHQPHPDAIRYACLIHIANWPLEIEGCVAPGLGFHPRRWGVTRSTDAMKGIIALLGRDEHTLTIKWENLA